MTGCFHSEGYGFGNWTEDLVKLRRTWIGELNTLYLFEVEFIATKLKMNLLLQSDEGLQKYQILPWSEGDAGTLCKVLFAGSRRSLIDDWNWDPGLASLICVFGWPKERESLVAGRIMLKLALSGKLSLEPVIGDEALSTFVMVPLTWSAKINLQRLRSWCQIQIILTNSI